MLSNRRGRAATLAAIVASIAWGCGRPAAPPLAEQPPEQTALRQVGEMYATFAEQHGRPPRGEADLATYAPAFSHGSMALVNRQVVVAWGAGLVPGSGSVLAHEKDVAKAGGPVLLQDGETIRVMTADEFKAAPKAGGK